MKNTWETLNKLYINRELKIFPVSPNQKTPAIPLWNKDCSSYYMQILYWTQNSKNCNFGLPCYENNLFVLDLDRHDVNKDGVENFKKLCEHLGIEEPRTLTQQTPSGGTHLIFRSDEDLSEVNATANAFPDYPGIDTRNRHYIVVEPSVINGKRYMFINDIEPQQMPQKLKEYILENCGKKGKEKTPYEKPKEVYVGDRDEQLFAYINHLYFKTDLDEEEISLLANYFNENHFEEPLSEKDVTYKVRKAFEKNRGSRIILMLGDKYE